MSPDLREVLDACRGAFYSAAGFSLLINLLMLLPAVYMLQLYDRVIPSGSESTLVMLTLIVMFLFVTLGALEWVRSIILVRVSTKIETLLNDRLYGIAFKQSLYSGGQRASSQPLDDLTALRQFLTGPGLFAFFDAPWIPLYIAVMFMFHAWIGWMAIITAVILIILAVLNEKATSGLLAAANGLSMKNSAQINKNLVNAEVIESMGMLANLRARWHESANQVLAMQSEASSRAGLLTSTSKTIRVSSQSLILGLGAYLAIQHEISPGSMIAGSILLGRALAPIDQMIGTWKGFVSARLQYKRIDELLLNVPADEEKMSLPDPKGHLSVEAVFVTPPGAKVPAVKGANFIVPVGVVVGVIGPSGAGKSTLARALLGIWPAASGKVRLDGADVFAWDRMELGPHIGYLPQDVELFEGSISENVARFSDVDPEAVVRACKKADVHDMVLRLPEGYDTVIGPGGGTLSGGQRQRIGLARAMYGSPCVIVLDEPNSNLDDQGESALAAALVTLKAEQVTVIVITHRRNILNVVDNLLVMKEGQVVAYGEKGQVLQSLQSGQSGQSGKAPAVSVPVIKPTSA